MVLIISRGPGSCRSEPMHRTLDLLLSSAHTSSVCLYNAIIAAVLCGICNLWCFSVHVSVCVWKLVILEVLPSTWDFFGCFVCCIYYHTFCTPIDCSSKVRVHWFSLSKIHTLYIQTLTGGHRVCYIYSSKYWRMGLAHALNARTRLVH